MNENQKENIEQETLDAEAIKAQIKEQAKNPSYDAPYFSAFLAFFKNYFNFKGRSSRREYWWFTLIYGGCAFILGIIAFFFIVSATMRMVIYPETISATPILIYGISLLVITIGMGIPALAQGARRFRDVGISLWVYWVLQGITIAISLILNARNIWLLISAVQSKYGAYTALLGYTNTNELISRLTLLSFAISIVVIVIACLPTQPFKIDGHFYDNRGNKVR